MSDIFISYAKKDKTRVKLLAHALKRKGWSVWWDERIPAGQSYEEVIEKALMAAKSVVVVWTKTSVKSQWVKNEAKRGLRRNVLVPVMLHEEVEIPLEFEHLQAAHLMDWHPEQEHQVFNQFIDDLTQVIGAPPSSETQAAPTTLREDPAHPSTSSTRKRERKPLRGRASKVKPEPEQQEAEPSVSTADVEDPDSPRESFRSQGAMEFSESNREPSQVSDDRSGDSTGTGQTTTSLPYLPIVLGLLAVVGALAYFLFDLGGSRDMGRYERDWQLPSSQTKEFTSSPKPEPKQPSPAPTQTRPTVKRETMPDEGLVTKSRLADEWAATKSRLAAGSAKANTGKDGAPMVLIPAGNFWMGSPDGEGGEDEYPRHQVTLDTFFIDKFEVTTSRHAKFFQETNRSGPKYWSANVVRQHGNKPVVGVDWNDAAAYCSWAGKRLPTEAEWEKAARGTDQHVYPWGNQPPTEQRANYGHCCDFKDYGAVTDVGSYEAGKSPYGAYDMAGNVWEWVADWYGENYYSKSPERNPTGPSSGEYRVLRGGSWNL